MLGTFFLIRGLGKNAVLKVMREDLVSLENWIFL